MTPLNPLNPAAGDVPVPEDPREIEAAERAGRISHQAFPYLGLRYGERGRKFTSIDSAWLAWLTRHDQQRVDEQIDWLRGVLSSRGMPSWVLEVHLRLLHRQLVRTTPAQKAKYRSLAVSAKRLEEDRDRQLPARQQQQLVADFEAALKRSGSRVLRGTARLLIASVADERLGVKNAVSSLVNWLGDLPSVRKAAQNCRRLSDADRRWLGSSTVEKCWTGAIEATIEQARQGAS